MERYTSTKKAQIWTLDLMIAIVMFVLALLSVYQYMLSLDKNEIGNIDELGREAQLISDHLLSKGTPEGWTINDVREIGITDGEFRIDENKWLSLSQLDYYTTKQLFNTRYNYYIYFVDPSGNTVTINGVEGFGKSGIDPSNIEDIETKRMIKINRLAAYDSEIIKMVLYIWQ